MYYSTYTPPPRDTQVPKYTVPPGYSTLDLYVYGAGPHQLQRMMVLVPVFSALDTGALLCRVLLYSSYTFITLVAFANLIPAGLMCAWDRDVSG